MRTQVGDFFNMETWRKDLLRIYNLGYFENVVPMPPLAPEYDTVALGLTLTERRTGSVNLGISYGERQRLAGFVRLEEQNLFGTGQSAFINTSRANISDGFSIEIGYTNPWIDRHHTGLSVNLYDKLVFRFSSTFFGGVSDPEDTERYDERRRGGSVTLSRPFSEYLTGFSTVRLEAVQTNNVATMEGDSFIQQDGDIMSLSTGLIDNARDLDVDPASGHYYKANIETGIANVTQVGGVFSDSDIIGRNPFTKFAVDGRWYYSPEGRREKPDDLKHVWALRVFAGTLAGNIPFFEQYFVGGADTIRGHPEDRFWGKHAAFTNLEYRIPLQKAMTLVTFVDYGDAWGGYETVNTFTQSTNFQGQLGYGIGLHFRTPLGPIRLDFAINQDGKSRTHFMIGHTF
jgi:outer membrane protein insertion porin family